MLNTDAMVTSADLMQAIEERRRGYSDGTMARLVKTEPTLAAYVESLAHHLSNPHKPNVSDSDEASRAVLRHLLTLVRAIEIGQWRLWHGSIDPRSPLGRVITGNQQPDQQDQTSAK